MNIKFNFKLKNILGWLICFIPFILIYSRAVADIIVVISGLYFLFIKIRDRDYCWLNEPWIKIGFIVYVWFLICSFFAYYPEVAFSRAIGWIRFLIFATALKYVFLADNYWKKKLLITVSLTVIYIIVFTLIEFSFIINKTIANDYLFDYGYLRLKGPMEQGGKSAFILSLLLYPIFFGILKEKNFFFIKKNFLIVSIFFISLICIFFSGHRFSSFILLLSSTIVFIFLLKNKKELFYKLLFSLTTVIILISITVPQQIERIIKSSFYEIVNYEKTPYWSASNTGIKMFKHHPITGVGLKNFHIACEYEKFISIEHKKYNITPWWGITKHRIEESTLKKNNENIDLDIRPPTCFTHVHNFYISLLAETGMVGFILFLLLIYQLINVFIKEKNIIKTPAFGILAPLIALLIPMIPTLNYFSNGNAVLIWFLVGWALSYTKHIKTI